MSMCKLRQRWYRRQQLLINPVPQEMQSWLFDASSLTARLLRKCPGQFRVEVLSQRMERPMLDEMRALSARCGCSTLIRQVRLYCGNQAVVYARTVIPVTTLRGAQRCYANLGNRPLGAMLFSDKSMRREEVMVSCLKPQSYLHTIIAETNREIWGRRSVFYVGEKPLLVSEYFLPALFEGQEGVSGSRKK